MDCTSRNGYAIRAHGLQLQPRTYEHVAEYRSNIPEARPVASTARYESINSHSRSISERRTNRPSSRTREHTTQRWNRTRCQSRNQERKVVSNWAAGIQVQDQQLDPGPSNRQALHTPSGIHIGNQYQERGNRVHRTGRFEDTPASNWHTNMGRITGRYLDCNRYQRQEVTSPFVR